MSTRRHHLDLAARNSKALPDLSPLDPANTSGDRANSPAAQQMLATILASSPVTTTSPSTSATPAASLPQRPVWKQPRARRIALAFTSVAAVAITSAVMLTGDPTAPASYASWSAVPVSATTTTEADLQTDTGGDIATQASKCKKLAGASVGVGGVPARPKEAAQRSVLVDRRGDWVFCVDVTKGSGADNDPLIALFGLKGGDDYHGTGATVWSHPYTWPTGTDVDVLSGSPYVTPDQDPVAANYSLIGSLGPQVAGVDINLADGMTVTATVHDDFWAAWWPGRASTARVDTLTVHTTAGTSYDVDPRTIQLPWAKYGARTSVWP